jgi:enediyne biosynthesis protein E4
LPLKMPDQVYRNRGNGRFEDASMQAGSYFATTGVGRGAAFGDIDNDGDTDIVVGQAAGRPRLLLNNVGNRNHWVGLRLTGRGPESRVRDMIGARVEIISAGGRTVHRRARSDGSYASANDARVVIGLDKSEEPPRARVRWPSGRIEEWPSLPIDRYTTLQEGAAAP